MKSVTCSAPVNIAVVKYWGKRDEKLILPVNSSLSVTLDQSQLRAKTSVAISPHFREDRLWLNGKEEDVSSERIQNVLHEIRRRARKRNGDDGSNCLFSSAHLHICSENNFPTAAGLASSAAGYACLVYALARLFCVEGDISQIARQGSGSACRSVFGGFVAWNQGELDSGSDSLAEPLFDEHHWPDLRILIIVVSDQKKHMGSTTGMQNSILTSDLMKVRAEKIVPKRMKEMKEAIENRNITKFCELTMKDSNNMHAICLDTYPSISYMTDVSRDIVRLVHAFNHHQGCTKVGYTYDAGPNACLYLEKSSLSSLFSLVQYYFPCAVKAENGFIRGADIPIETLDQELLSSIKVPIQPDAVKYCIHTKAGPGPQLLDESESLFSSDGMPKHLRNS